jgi:hypothetical protein
MIMTLHRRAWTQVGSGLRLSRQKVTQTAFRLRERPERSCRRVYLALWRRVWGLQFDLTTCGACCRYPRVVVSRQSSSEFFFFFSYFRVVVGSRMLVFVLSLLSSEPLIHQARAACPDRFRRRPCSPLENIEIRITYIALEGHSPPAGR